ncbi:MAG: MBL fold metallo-hydrolase [Zavarzinia sp.]|nr:MBL fold metallo-hydrolase [Zavarzinia sp.]
MTSGTKVTVLGCGTSGGVPSITGNWGRCDPNNPKNRRRRVSILVERGETSLIVDASPDLREQCISAGVQRLDAVLLTHDHADHCHGIDDLRGIAGVMRRRVPIHADARTLGTVSRRFSYIFQGNGGYPAICDGIEIDGPFSIGEIDVLPFRQIHGDIETLGFRFGNIAYSTDVNELPEEAFAALEGVEVWIVDALRHTPHPSHAHLEKTLSWIERVRPARAILTHMTWEMDYDSLIHSLPVGVEPAYDGMVIPVD